MASDSWGAEDADVADEVCKLLQEDGIEVLLETKAVSVHANGSGIDLRLRGPVKERTVAGLSPAHRRGTSAEQRAARPVRRRRAG